MKLTARGWLRPAGRVAVCAVTIWLAGMAAAHAQAVSTTTVEGTVYQANGQPAGGTLVVSWRTFTTAAGQLISAGQTTVTVGADGYVSVNLAPNQGATPAGEYYTAVFYKSDGTVSTQYWTVPAAAQASLAEVQAQVMPSAQAVQAVSKAYVDQAVSQALGSQLSASGGSLTGPLLLSGDPSQPLQAADKHYVDSSFSAALPLSGGTITGPASFNAPVTFGSSVTASSGVSFTGTGAAQTLTNLLPGAVSDGANGLTQGGAITAASLNDTWDLKRKFGATGSNQTITCTATASSYTLTGCSSADFAANQYVYVPQAGTLPTISTPGAPTAVCGTDRGTCTGTGTTYCYEIVAEQTGYYGHGPLTAPSASTCVTQPTQTAQAAPHSGNVDYYTTVGWTAVTSQSAVLIYKSIAGGPYTFYERVTTTASGTVQDFNHAPSAQFTAAELGWPSTVPAGTTASDLYAQIAAISGSTVTLEARTGSAGTPGAQPASTASQPGISGAVTIQHDDSPAFAAAWVAERAAGGGYTISIPSGTYNTHGYNQPTGTGYRPAVINLDGLNNVTFVGAGRGETNINNEDGEFAVGLCGFGNTVACTGEFWGGGGQGYILSDPATVGSMQITLATPAQSSNFSVGGYITIFDNASGYPQEFYAEINKVLAINSTTGVLTLAYPLDKTYSATLPSPYSACAGCSATPMAYPIVGGMTATNITFKDLSVRNSGSTFLNENTIDGITEDNIDVNTQALWEEGLTRHVNLTHGSRYLEDPWSPLPTHGFLDAAAASSDEIANGVTYINPHYSSGNQECSEGSANISAIGVNRILSGSADPPSGQSGGVPSLFGAAMCWNYNLRANTISLKQMNVDGLFAGDTGKGGSGAITGNTIETDSTSLVSGLAFSVNTANPAIQIGGNTIITPSGVNLGQATLNTFSTLAVGGVSGGFLWYTGFPVCQAQITTFTLTGNLTSINTGGISCGSGNVFEWVFTGNFSLPATCDASKYVLGTTAVNFKNGVCPVMNPSTHELAIWFQDEGAAGDWEISRDYSPPNTAIGSASVRAGAWSISAATSVAVTFATAFASTPTSCDVIPSASSAATGQPYVTSLSITGMTVNVPTSGSLSGTYQCVLNNSN